MTYRITPERHQLRAIIGQNGIRGASLPDSEIQFLQAGLTMYGKIQFASQRLGKGRAAAQRRGHDASPARDACNGGAHLVPAHSAQGIVAPAPIQRAAFGRAVAQQHQPNAGFILCQHGIFHPWFCSSRPGQRRPWSAKAARIACAAVSASAVLQNPGLP
jgi:hypothetical protein